MKKLNFNKPDYRQIRKQSRNDKEATAKFLNEMKRWRDRNNNHAADRDNDKVSDNDKDRDNDKVSDSVTTSVGVTEPVSKPTPSRLSDDVLEKVRRSGLNLRTFNQCVNDGAKKKDPRNLYKGLWYEGELCALYADTNLGKSILAVQIGEHIASMGIPTMYVDLEMSDKGVEKRCRDEHGKIHVFPDNYYRTTMSASQFIAAHPDADTDGFTILSVIEDACRLSGARTLIIDNITAICAGVESGETAVTLVNRLLSMRDDNGWSILFVAHTPKLDRTQPITRDSMAGSKRVISLIDSAFAVGEKLSDPSVRYIKQTKVRQDEYLYHENNVLVCKIERVDGMLRFVEQGTARERELLAVPKSNPNSKEDRDSQILELRKQGKTIVEIAEELEVPKSTVHRVVAKVDWAKE